MPLSCYLDIYWSVTRPKSLNKPFLVCSITAWMFLRRLYSMRRRFSSPLRSRQQSMRLALPRWLRGAIWHLYRYGESRLHSKYLAISRHRHVIVTCKRFVVASVVVGIFIIAIFVVIVVIVVITSCRYRRRLIRRSCRLPLYRI